jgi:signal peptidase I
VSPSLRSPVARRERARKRGSLLELVLIIAVALGLALGIQAVLVKPFRIPSQSMEPTLDVGQRVLVDRVSLRFSEPHEGDIVVFHPPSGADTNACGVDHQPDQACPRPTEQKSDTNFIKRVVGEPGDRLKVLDGRVFIDGEPLDEPYVQQDANCEICDLPEEITIPPGHFFMMGDNRGSSADSREWGPIPEDWIIGNAFFTYWPPNRIGPE